MIAVIFEVIPKAEYQDEYFHIAAELKKTLLKMDGFISIERFQSLTDINKLLSLSFWQDEASVKKWRLQTCHRDAQEKGKSKIFGHYRLRVANVNRDYTMIDRAQTPDDISQ
ncbi:MAG: heme-degrading monooxygenase HmoA [Alteromonadaceae bacterium]|jgi:heme-degrading monooxygenase HmoA